MGADSDQLSHLQLRLLLCGAVGSGKSILLDGLLAGPRSLVGDQVATRGTCSQFCTARRRFLVTEVPGDEQSTRGLVTAARTSECVVLLVDAERGINARTRRLSFLVALLGIQHVLVAINKMDLVGRDPARFGAIRDDYARLAARIGLRHVTCVPVSAALSENVSERGAFGWFEGPSVLDYLESVPIEHDLASDPLRMPVEAVNLSAGCIGTVVSGAVSVGDDVLISPSGHTTRIERIVTADGDLPQAAAGQSVTVKLKDEVHASRGDLIAATGTPPEVADQLQATVVWMHEEPMLRGRSYMIRVGTATATATVAPLRYKVNVDSLEHVAASKLELNEIGVCDLELSRPVAFDAYAENRDTGGFILIDPITDDTVGAGMIRFGLRRAHNLRWQELTIDRAARAEHKHQHPCVLWFTGLSGAGKSTIANLVEIELHARGHHTYILDGDNVRHGLNRDLGFTNADRVENIRRVAEVARLMIDAGLVVIVSFISPFASERRMARSLFEDNEFFELFVDTPLEVAEARDPKGLYGKARRGELRNFTGIDSPYEPPSHPDLRIDTTDQSPAQAAASVVALLQHRGLLPEL